MIAGFWLQIDGFPRLLGTKDLPGLAPSTFEPSDDAPTGTGAMPGRLDWPSGFDERIEPVTGAMRASGMTFRLVDDPEDPVFDQYLSRNPRRIVRGSVASSITESDTEIPLNATVPSSITGLSYPAVVWIDEEAILVDSYAADTLSNCTRGYLGTRAAPHVVDTELGAYPEVWPTFPWSTGRRVILWAVESSDFETAVALWRGYLRAPRLDPTNGAAYLLDCEALSTWELQRPLGGSVHSTRLRGYSSEALRLRWHQANGYGGADTAQFVATYHEFADKNSPVVLGSIDEFVQWSRDTLATRLQGTLLAGISKTANNNVSVRFERVGNQVQFQVEAGGTGGDQCALSVLICGQEQMSPAFDRSGGIYRGTLSATFPQCALTGYSSIPKPLPVTRLDGLPATFERGTVYSDGQFATQIRPVLTGLYDEDTRLLVLPESSTEDDASIGGGPSITATVRYVPTRGGKGENAKQRKIIERRGVNSSGYAVFRDTGVSRAWIDKAIKLSYARWVVTDHWACGLKRALGDATIASGSDGRNWTFDDISSVTRLTTGGLSAREWYFDGTRTIKEAIGDTLTLDGCAIVTGLYGRLRIALVQPARKHWTTADYAAEIDCSPRPGVGEDRVPIVRGALPEWTTLADALTNVVSVSSDAIEVSVNEVRSFQSYGRRAPLELKLEGLPLATHEGEDPYAIMQRLLQRITGLWSEPVDQVTVTVPLLNRNGDSLVHKATGLYLGKYVLLRNGFNLPDGEGSRGLDSRGAFISGRQVSLRGKDAAIKLTLWLLQECYAYAPAVKAASIVAATGVVTADTGYIKRGHMDATDYAGGLLGTGGVRGFAAGDKVRLVTRDSTSPSQETYTILSVNSIAGTITMTTPIATAPFDWPTLAAGWVDVIPATYTTVVSSQKNHQFVGDGNAAEGVIGASTDSSREFAP